MTISSLRIVGFRPNYNAVRGHKTFWQFYFHFNENDKWKVLNYSDEDSTRHETNTLCWCIKGTGIHIILLYILTYVIFQYNDIRKIFITRL